jgi:RHS repeat-associated protein
MPAVFQATEPATTSSAAGRFSAAAPPDVTEDAWGNLQAGDTLAGPAFTGREWDPEIGLYYYRARYYDPHLGRFISEDPIGFRGGENFYAYVGGNPVSQKDPLGLLCKSCGLKMPPEYNVSGTIPGGTQFRWGAEFMNDADHDPECCEVRQEISWTGRDTPLHEGFPKTYKPGTWYEDRSRGDKRYGRRTGKHSHPDQYDYYTETGYSGTDEPSGYNPGTQLRFRLIVVDVCNGDRTIYTSRTITVAF